MALFDTSEDLGEREDAPVQKGKTSMRCHTVRGKQIFDVRCFNSEAALLGNAPWHFESGKIYHVISGGDVDSLTFLRHVVRQQHLRFCLVSSWCYGVEDVSEMGSWLDRGAVDRFDFYSGEIAKASYAMCAAELSDIARRGGRTARRVPQPFQGYGVLRRPLRRRDHVVRERKHQPAHGEHHHYVRHGDCRFL